MTNHGSSALWVVALIATLLAIWFRVPPHVGDRRRDGGAAHHRAFLGTGACWKYQWITFWQEPGHRPTFLPELNRIQRFSRPMARALIIGLAILWPFIGCTLIAHFCCIGE